VHALQNAPAYFATAISFRGKMFMKLAPDFSQFFAHRAEIESEKKSKFSTPVTQ
jgi:hypothetical protein